MRNKPENGKIQLFFINYLFRSQSFLDVLLLMFCKAVTSFSRCRRSVFDHLNFYLNVDKQVLCTALAKCYELYWLWWFNRLLQVICNHIFGLENRGDINPPKTGIHPGVYVISQIRRTQNCPIFRKYISGSTRKPSSLSKSEFFFFVAALFDLWI